MKSNYNIGLFFVREVKHTYRSGLALTEIKHRLNQDIAYKLDGNCFKSSFSFFQIMFPFGHFAQIKGMINELENTVTFTIRPITVRLIQLFILVSYSLILSAFSLYNRSEWSILAIACLHFGVIATILFIIRLMYVADVRYKMYQNAKLLKLAIH